MPSRKSPARNARTRALSVLGCVLAGVALAACGSSHTPLTHEDNTGAGGINSSYVSLGDLQYQVQLSRALNPYLVEDRSYLAGIPPAALHPPPGQLWFAVFLLVVNNSDSTALAANHFLLTDTEGNTYRPVALPEVNPFAYRPGPIPKGGQIPVVGSPAYYGPTQSALLLFKIPTSAYDNRPLIMTIHPQGIRSIGSVTLDV